MAVLVRSGRKSIPGLRRALGLPASRSRSPGRDAAGARPCRAADARRAACRAQPRERGPRPRGVRRPVAGRGPADGSPRRARRGRRTPPRSGPAGEGEGARPRGPARPPVRRRSSCGRPWCRTVFLEGSLRPGRRARLEGCTPSCARRAPSSTRVSRRSKCSGPCGQAPSWPGGCAAAVLPVVRSARLANRDLDSLVALFDDGGPCRGTARPRRRAQLPGHARGPGDPGRHAAGARGQGTPVRLLTAHRSKGLEWRLVVVAHVQAEGWPDLRRRSTPAAGRPHRQRRTRASRPSPPGSCCSRSAGCSTSRARVPGSAWW